MAARGKLEWQRLEGPIGGGGGAGGAARWRRLKRIAAVVAWRRSSEIDASMGSTPTKGSVTRVGSKGAEVAGQRCCCRGRIWWRWRRFTTAQDSPAREIGCGAVPRRAARQGRRASPHQRGAVSEFRVGAG